MWLLNSNFSFIYPGIVFNYQVSKFLQIAPSINFRQSKFGFSTFPDSSKYQLHQIHMPIDLRLPIALGNGKLLLMAAPSISYNLYGTVESYINTGGVPVYYKRKGIMAIGEASIWKTINLDESS